MSSEIDRNQLNVLTSEILLLKRQTAANIIEIGIRLVKVKEMLPHGEWLKWLEERVDFTERTAQRFMKAAQMFGNATPVSHLDSSKVIVLLDMPVEEREQIIQGKPQVIPSTGEAKTIGEMTKRELEQVKKALKDAEQARSALEKANAKMIELEEKVKKERAARQSLEKEIERLKQDGTFEVQSRVAELERRLENEKDIAVQREAEAAKLRAAVVSLEKRLKELENVPPKVVEKVVEIPVEKVVVEPDPAVEAELETAKTEIERYRAEAEQWRKEKAAFEAIVAQLKKNQSSGKAAPQKDSSEMRQVLERASSLSRELGGVVDRLVKNHGETLVSLARSGADESGDLREIANRTVESMAYTMFRLSLEFLADRMAGLFDLLEEKPRFTVLRGGKVNAEKA